MCCRGILPSLTLSIRDKTWRLLLNVKPAQLAAAVANLTAHSVALFLAMLSLLQARLDRSSTQGGCTPQIWGGFALWGHRWAVAALTACCCSAYLPIHSPQSTHFYRLDALQNLRIKLLSTHDSLTRRHKLIWILIYLSSICLRTKVLLWILSYGRSERNPRLQK